jgi:hypothetical protein
MYQPCGICDSLINISRVMYNHVVTSAISVVLIVWVSRGFRDWLRHRSPAAGERALFKKRLPNWVNTIEGLILLVLLILISVGLFFGSFTLHHIMHSNTEWGHASDIASGLLVVPSLFISFPIAMLIANVISWLIPPVKKANELAMTGLPAASYAQLNRGLLLLLAWFAPLCLAATLLGVIDPWM